MITLSKSFKGYVLLVFQGSTLKDGVILCYEYNSKYAGDKIRPEMLLHSRVIAEGDYVVLIYNTRVQTETFRLKNVNGRLEKCPVRVSDLGEYVTV